MSRLAERVATASAAATAEARGALTPEALSALRLTRSISATWWYVALAILIFELAIVILTVAALVGDGFTDAGVAWVGVSGMLWWASTVLPVLDYRHRTDATPLVVWRRHLPPLLMGVAYALSVGLVSGVWALVALPVIQVIMLLSWPPGVRLRVVIATTALLVALAVVDLRGPLDEGAGSSWYQLVFLATTLPAITVTSLWWWDVLIALDRARASEARLAATQERLRVATDVHDLQGHHLQVIALQLELADRLMPRDPEAGMEQLRAARLSVDDARQGTRDLATRYRSVPLGDELANAVDLLRAAGTEAEAAVDPEASLAPPSALGPVIRETTTNVLRHGGGRWARLSLAHVDRSWRYEISNDVPAGAPEGTGGSGLEGLGRRAAEAGGALEVRREDGTFTVTVTVPADEDADEDEAR